MASAAFPRGRPHWLPFLPRFLFAPGPEAIAYLLKAWLLALLPSLVIAGAVGAVGGPPEGALAAPPPLFLLLSVLVAPLAETLLMILPLLVLQRLAGSGPAVVLNALLWGGVHSLVEPLWGLVVWWPFLILSVALLVWRERSLGASIAVVTGIHTLQNAVAAALALVAA